MSTTGRKFSEETRKKMSIARIGKIPWNKGLKGFNPKGRKLFEKGHINWNAGKKWSIESRKKMSESHKGKNCKEKSHFWKGGITPKYISERNKLKLSIEYRLWREAVFARDNWTCHKCKIRGIYLHPHHIQNWVSCIELRTSIENGITLCKKCHIDFHKKYGKVNNNLEQLNEFLNI